VGKVLRFYIIFLLFVWITASQAVQKNTNEPQTQSFPNMNAIVYQPILSGVFEFGLREKLMEKLQLFQKVTLPPITVAKLKERAVSDMKAAIDLLKNEGYYGAMADYEIDLKTTPITVNFMVRTGPQYKILKFNLSSNTLKNLLFNALTLDPARFGMVLGTPATLEYIRSCVKKIFEILTDNGYPYTKVLNEKIVIDHDQKGIIVNLHMNPGALMRFGEAKITVGGDEDEEFIKNRLQWKEGDIYSNMKVLQTIETLNNTQKYAFVKITRPREQPKDNKIQMHIEAFPNTPRAIAWKFGYDANRQYNLKVGWKGVNVFDDGSLMKVMAGLGRYYNGAEVEHIIPDLLWVESYLSTKFSVQKTRTDAYNALSGSLATTLSTPVIDKIRADVGLSLKFSSNKPHATLLQDHNATVLTLPIAVSYTNFDDVLNPRKGWDASLSLIPAMQLAPQRQFVQYKLSQSILQPLNEAHDLVLKAWYKLYASPSAGRNILPVDWRFYAGGMGTIRGYGYQMAGKMNSDGNPAGGRSLFAMGAEVNYFVHNDLALGGFFDMGSAYESRFPSFSNTMFMGVGGALTYVSAIGDIQVSLGFPLRRRQMDKRAQIYVGIGQDF
jgi:translocation and assembly module TamA